MISSAGLTARIISRPPELSIIKGVFLWVEWIRRWVPTLVAVSVAATLLGLAARWTLHRPAIASSSARRNAVRAALGPCYAVLFAGTAMTSHRIAHLFPPAASEWITALALLLVVCSLSCFLHAWFRRHPRFDPERRTVLTLARQAIVAAPALTAVYGVVLGRFDVRVKEVRVRVPRLPKDLDGLRIAQLSDIHRGAFLSRAEVDRAVAMANELRPHLAVVTGDLITRRGDPLEDCVDSLAALRADAGVWGCLGNHEVYAGAVELATAYGARRGIRFLRRASQLLRFGQARLNLTGVDYQRMHLPYLEGCEELVRPDALNLLLSHNPDVFPVAAAKGFQVTLAGHTHGGQINVEILNDNVNLARFFTQYVLGLYEQNGASIYVTPGLGTVGVPLRLGAPPEVTLIRLCAG